MAEFLTGQPLVYQLRKIIENARDLLVIVSPYIKLDEEIRDWFEKHLNNRHLHILLIFGKENPISDWDLGFFKRFPNIKIIYAENLHAKYYANEKEGLMTSLNLHEYSIGNNIEFGYCAENSYNANYYESDSTTDAFNYALKIATYPYNELVYKSRYCKEWLYNNNHNTSYHYNSHKGYCIHCGRKIEFNIERPMCYDCYQSRSMRRGNAENFCHYSGEESYRQTSMQKPILPKNWNRALEYEDKYLDELSY